MEQCHFPRHNQPTPPKSLAVTDWSINTILNIFRTLECCWHYSISVERRGNGDGEVSPANQGENKHHTLKCAACWLRFDSGKKGEKKKIATQAESFKKLCDVESRTRMLLHTQAKYVASPSQHSSFRLVVRNQIKVDGVPSLPSRLLKTLQTDVASEARFLSNISSLCMLESNEKHHLFEAVMLELNFSSHSQW